MKDYSILIHKVISGVATEQERTEFNDWVSESPANQQEFDTMKMIWDLSDDSDGQPELLNEAREEATRFETTTNILTQKDGTIQRLKRRSKRLLMLALLFVVATVTVFALYTVRHPYQDQAMEAANLDNNKCRVMLEDSSIVFLNKASSLSYRGMTDSRNIHLEGEAFFSAAKNPHRPLFVMANRALIKVVGTSFVVRAYPKDKTEVFVITGAVEVTSDGNVIQLTAGEKVELSPDHKKFIKGINRDPNFNSWYTGVIRFDEAPLDVILQFIAKEYGVEVRLKSKDLLACRFTGEFKAPDVEEILETLSFSMKVQYREAGRNKYELTGKGCI
ncbi:MAG TPA: FecR domain-containing protein [Chryseolinea sp.]|nr:FecR domain-containing protein [Chryseolinea sp.]